MLETYKVGVVLELGGNVQTGVDKLIMQMEALDRRAKDAGATFAKLSRNIEAIGSAGRSISALSRAMEKLGTGGNRGVADFEKMAVAAKAMTTASERMTTALRDSSRLAAEVARATETAARASSTAGRTSSRSHGGRGHDVMMAGLGASAVGATLTKGAETAFERGMEVAHLRTQILTDTRVSPAQADAMVNRAYDATSSAPGTKVSENLHALIDLKQVTGSLEEAEALLPRFARLSAMLQVVDKRRGGSGDSAFAAAKAMELLGGMVDERQVNGHTERNINPELLQKRLDMIARVAVATNGRVAPQDYLGFAKQARVGGMNLSDEFTYERLPAIMLGMGGAKAGTALMSMAQVFRGGKLSVESMEEMQKLGLAGADGITAKGKKRTVHSDKIYDYAFIGTDPDKWVAEAQKRMEANGVHGTSAQIDALMRASQRSTIAGILAQFLKDQPVIDKEAANIRATRPDVATYIAQNDPAAKLQQMQAAMDKLFTTLGSAGMGDLVKVMDAVTGGLNGLAAWAERNPTLSRVITDTVAGLGAISTALGTLSLAVLAFGPALKLLGISGGGAAAGGAAAGGAGGWLGAASRAAMGGAGAGAALVGGALYLGGTTDPIEAERRLNLLRKQQRAGAGMQMQGGVDPITGEPLASAKAPAIVRLQGDINLDGRKMGSYLAEQMGKVLNGPRSGAIGSDLTLNPWSVPLGN